MLVAVVAVVLVVAYGAVHTLLSIPTAPPRSSSPQQPPSPAPTASTTSAVPSGLPQLVHPATAGGLLPAAGTGNVYVQTATTVYRLELATGRIFRTSTPHLEQFNSFIAGPGWILSKTDDDGTGVIIRDGQPARPLPHALQTPGRLNHGPGGRLWLQPEPSRGVADTIRLLTIDGQSVPGQTARFDTSDGDYIFPSDGADHLLKTNAGGTYQISAAGARRISHGIPVAVSRHHLLVWQCNDTARCNPYDLDRRTNTTTRLARARQPLLTTPDVLDAGPNGELSPDGRYAALHTQRTDGETRLELIDLKTGLQRTVPGTTTDTNPNAQACWTPNGRWLLAITNHRLLAIDAHTGAVETIPFTNEPILHIATPGASGN